MPNKSVILKFVGACSVLAVGTTAVWFATMPYPIQVWWKSREKVHYIESWPVSQADYNLAKQSAIGEMHLREIFWAVSCTSADEITFTTLERWSGPLAASGRTITVKRFGKEWRVPGGVWGFWVS